jgi:SAM-dependent methyltransferase
MAYAMRLNWGCGERPARGWVNSDVRCLPGVDLCCDIREGLPTPTGCFDYVVSVHALQMLAYTELVPVLRELRRVLRPGGILRLALPDLDRAIAAYTNGDYRYFCVPDEDERTIGGKLVAHVLWYGSSRTLFTSDFALDLLARAGFMDCQRRAFRTTGSPDQSIVELDDRARETLFVEAIGP